MCFRLCILFGTIFSLNFLFVHQKTNIFAMLPIRLKLLRFYFCHCFVKSIGDKDVASVECIQRIKDFSFSNDHRRFQVDSHILSSVHSLPSTHSLSLPFLCPFVCFAFLFSSLFAELQIIIIQTKHLNHVSFFFVAMVDGEEVNSIHALCRFVFCL